MLPGITVSSPAGRLAIATAIGLCASTSLFFARVSSADEEVPVYSWCPPLPEAAQEVERRNPGTFQARAGFANKVARLKENRRLLQAGLLEGTPDEIHSLTTVAGTVEIPILLGYYADTFFLDYPREEYQKMLFDGPWPTGTMTGYYAEVSYGNLNATGTVYDWFQVSQPGAYYYGTSNGTDPENSHTHHFVHEVLAGNDAAVDYGIYDNDGPDGNPNSGDDDGIVDFAAFVHYDRGGEVGDSGIWSHHSGLAGGPLGNYVTNDSAASGGFIQVDGYTIMPGLDFDYQMIRISIFCHEFGHAFALLDLYDPDPEGTGPSGGIGSWGIMGPGVWAHPESPPHYCAWSKTELGWITPGVVASDLWAWPLQSSSLTPTAMRLWADGAGGTPEYFLVEYRTQTGFDQYIPASGILVWHIDENSPLPDGALLNFDETHKRIDLECADQTGVDHVVNTDNIDRFGTHEDGNFGDAGDPFCVGDYFGSSAGVDRPSSVAYNGTETGIWVEATTACGASSVRTNLIVGNLGPALDLCIRDCTTDVCSTPSGCDVWWGSPDIYIDNNNDGIIDPPAAGLVNRFWVVVRNVGTDTASGANLDFYVADPALGMTWPGSAFHVASQTLSLIPGGGQELAYFDWLLISPPPGVEHYCFGAVVSHPDDPPTSDIVIQANNVAQVNIQELYAKAGDTPPTPSPNQCDGSLHADNARGVDVLVEELILQLCNPSATGGSCSFQVVIGSPPAYDDAVIPADWNVSFSVTEGVLGPNECTTLTVTVTDADAHHLDYAYIPITLLCNGTPMGGELLEFHVDNFGPAPICGQFSVVAEFPPDSDDRPLDEIVEIRWQKTETDEQDWPEQVERWRIYNGSTPNFVISPSSLVVETCLDGDDRTSKYEHFAAYPDDTAKKYYKLVSVDRAGNASVSCTTVMQVIASVDAPGSDSESTKQFALSRPRPNPLLGETRLEYSVPAGGGEIQICVYDVRGRRVATLVDRFEVEGRHEVKWAGVDESGNAVTAGAYFIRLVAGTTAQSRKIIVHR